MFVHYSQVLQREAGYSRAEPKSSCGQLRVSAGSSVGNLSKIVVLV